MNSCCCLSNSIFQVELNKDKRNSFVCFFKVLTIDFGINIYLSTGFPTYVNSHPECSGSFLEWMGICSFAPLFLPNSSISTTIVNIYFGGLEI